MSAPRSARNLRGLPIGPASLRAFTLVELVVVVLIITVFAALAVPTVVIQMRDRRIQESARQIAIVYRQARLRAMGRGAAVLVRFNGTNFNVLEARQGTAAGACENLPMSNCLDRRWVADTDLSRPVDGHIEATAGDMPDVAINMFDAGGGPVPELEVCFTPMGRAFSREDINDTVPLQPMTEAYLAKVSRTGVTRTREVVLMPNGTARLSARVP
jgi:prepilin-type N-terminal cleavage/methylation domain-containing protein